MTRARCRMRGLAAVLVPRSWWRFWKRCRTRVRATNEGTLPRIAAENQTRRSGTAIWLATCLFPTLREDPAHPAKAAYPLGFLIHEAQIVIAGRGGNIIEELFHPCLDIRLALGVTSGKLVGRKVVLDVVRKLRCIRVSPFAEELRTLLPHGFLDSRDQESLEQLEHEFRAGRKLLSLRSAETEQLRSEQQRIAEYHTEHLRMSQRGTRVVPGCENVHDDHSDEDVHRQQSLPSPGANDGLPFAVLACRIEHGKRPSYRCDAQPYREIRIRRPFSTRPAAAAP